jgi:hypothetical protein
MSLPPAPGPGQQSIGIPKYFLRIIGEVEKGKCDWTIHMYSAGVSLTLRPPATLPPRTHVRRRRHLGKSVNTDTCVHREQDHTNISSCAIPKNNTPIRGEPMSRKSPSCKQRDRNRQKWWKRKFHHNSRPLGIHRQPSSPIPRPLNTCESENPIQGERADTNRETVHESLLVHAPSGTDTNLETVQESLLAENTSYIAHHCIALTVPLASSQHNDVGTCSESD